MARQQKLLVTRALPGLVVGRTYIVTRREQGRGLRADAFLYEPRAKRGLHLRDWRVSLAILTGAFRPYENHQTTNV